SHDPRATPDPLPALLGEGAGRRARPKGQGRARHAGEMRRAVAEGRAAQSTAPRSAVPSHKQVEQVFRTRRRMLWGLCYRLTGVAADADELLQETFTRAIERPPPAVDDEWHRWLVRVATNLSLDRLRARRRRTYVGSWLPSPIETPDALEPATDAAAGVE